MMKKRSLLIFHWVRSLSSLKFWMERIALFLERFVWGRSRDKLNSLCGWKFTFNLGWMDLRGYLTCIRIIGDIKWSLISCLKIINCRIFLFLVLLIPFRELSCSYPSPKIPSIFYLQQRTSFIPLKHILYALYTFHCLMFPLRILTLCVSHSHPFAWRFQWCNLIRIFVCWAI